MEGCVCRLKNIAFRKLRNYHSGSLVGLSYVDEIITVGLMLTLLLEKKMCVGNSYDEAYNKEWATEE